MTPESLVATRETCMRLKEKGFTQDTHFCWAEPYRYQTDRTPVVYPRFLGGQHAGSPPREYCAAPTLAEVLEQLPDCKLFKSHTGRPTIAGYLYVSKVNHIGQPPYRVEYINNGGIMLESVAHDSPAEAAALLWEKVNR